MWLCVLLCSWEWHHYSPTAWHAPTCRPRTHHTRPHALALNPCPAAHNMPPPCLSPSCPQVVGLKRLAPYIEHMGGKAQRPNYKALEALKQQGPQQGVCVCAFVDGGSRGVSRRDGHSRTECLPPHLFVAPMAGIAAAMPTSSMLHACQRAS